MDPRATIGCLVGAAVGDSLGLPYEGLSARRAAKMYPGAPAHHLLPGKGMVSDDTEHACFTAQALIRSDGDVKVFGRRLASSLRWWLAGLPAGIGLATLRAIFKSCIGFPPSRSGVFSAGNGPAMRSAIIGVALGHSPSKMAEFVRCSTRITHTDPKAFHGALAVALAAHCAAASASVSPEAFIAQLETALATENANEFLGLVKRAAESAARHEPVAEFAVSIGSRGGISGYMFHTVPCVLQAWFKHGNDFAAGLTEIIGAGGDTDTAGAIFGGIAGAAAGKEGIPPAWISDIVEWPRSVAWIERLGDALARSAGDAGGRPGSPGYFVPGILPRNAFFMVIVLLHGFRRLVPPY
ncbi:MAG TPA: ADP-ribosylglycohydrolase family protein [Ramlibacter sp.]|nr:ADP-ribosylglycohydrolase family protein [Ramlibacter sp.]